MDAKKVAAGILAAGTLATGGAVAADQTVNPYTDTGDSYRMEVAADIPQDDHIEIAKDSPAVTLSRWNDEQRVTITPEFQGAGRASKAKRPFLSKQMEFTHGDQTAFVEPSATSSEFDIDFTLDAEPESNVFTYQIDGADDLDFFFQPPLTDEPVEGERCTETQCTDAAGNVTRERPENVVGSYAVYSKTKRDHLEGQTNYGTGKLFHIYRPLATDANGSSTWAELSYADGALSVTVPQEFLDAAAYPVTVDPTFGYTTAGASSYRSSEIKGSAFTSTQAGDITQLSGYVASGSEDFQKYLCAVYAGSAGSVGSKQANAGPSVAGGAFFVAGWMDIPITYSTTASDYWLFFWDAPFPADGGTDEAFLAYYDTGASNQSLVKEIAPASGWPTTFSSPTYQTRKYSIYATYTASGGGGSSVPDDGVILFE